MRVRPEGRTRFVFGGSRYVSLPNHPPKDLLMQHLYPTTPLPNNTFVRGPAFLLIYLWLAFLRFCIDGWYCYFATRKRGLVQKNKRILDLNLSACVLLLTGRVVYLGEWAISGMFLNQTVS